MRDNGTGMDEKTRARCLEPFFSTKAKFGGTGLGLAMVYGMVKRHKGAIEIESTPGKGTCIRLIFPLGQKIPRPMKLPFRTLREAAPSASLELTTKNVRRILKDTSPASIIRLGGLDRKRRTTCSAMPREENSLSTLLSPTLACRLSGGEVAKTVKKECPDIPVVMMTGWGTMMKQAQETVPEVDALMGKPPRIKELNELLLRLTARAIYFAKTDHVFSRC